MITLQDLTRQYVKLYECVRKYIWPFKTVEDLAELEIAVYNRFPDIEEVRVKFEKFYRDIQLECKEDEELNKEVEAFRKVLDSDDIMYSKILKVNEVYDYEDSEIEDRS